MQVRGRAAVCGDAASGDRHEETAGQRRIGVPAQHPARVQGVQEAYMVPVAATSPQLELQPRISVSYQTRKQGFAHLHCVSRGHSCGALLMDSCSRRTI